MGVVAAFSRNTLPEGWLLCDGSAVNRETYAALFNIIDTTYGTGDGNTTYNIPNLIDKFIEGAATAGIVKNAGLPNITGATNYLNATGVSQTTGALYWSSTTSQKAATAAATGMPDWLSIDASRSNPIYGNSDTVQPPALTMRYAIYTGNVGKHCWLRQS